MAEPRVWAGIDELRITAAELEVKSLGEKSPMSVNRAIGHAVNLLIEDREEGSLTPRESFVAVLEINQFKPHNVWWTGPPNIPKMLDAFDHLYKLDSPHMIPDHYGRLVAGITGSTTPIVEIVEQRRGMGSLPDASISFDSFVVSGEVKHPVIALEETPKTVGLYELSKSAVGALAIQEYINALELEINEFECGHGYSSNESQVKAVYDLAVLLANAKRFRLNTNMIKAQLKRAEVRRETELMRRRYRRRYTSRTPLIDRNIRFRQSH